MRISFISNLFPDNNELYRGQDNANLLHAFPDGFQFQVISPRPSLNILFRKDRVSRELDADFIPKFIDYFYVPKFGTLFNHHLFYYSIRLCFLEHISSYQPDLLVVSWSFPDAVAMIRLAKECNLPVVVITQGSDVHIYLDMPCRSKIILNSLQDADFIITRSIKLANIVQRKARYVRNVLPIYNGVDQSVFRSIESMGLRSDLVLDRSGMYLLYVGNFYKVKNPELIIRALFCVLRKCPELPVQLLMIGEGYLKAKMEDLASELSLSSSVHFLGRRTSSEIAAYMQASDLLCIPSFNEGLPNVLLEALSCGLPVVSTDVGGISEVLSDKRYGSLVSSFEPEVYANHIIQRLKLTEDRSAIIDYSKRFSWENTVQSYIKIFRDVADGR